MSNRYAMSCESLIPLSSIEFAVSCSKPLSERIFAISATSLGDVPVPLNSRIEAAGFDSFRAQPVSVSKARHETNRPILVAMTTMPRKVRDSLKRDNVGPSSGRGTPFASMERFLVREERELADAQDPLE